MGVDLKKEQREKKFQGNFTELKIQKACKRATWGGDIKKRGWKEGGQGSDHVIGMFC